MGLNCGPESKGLVVEHSLDLIKSRVQISVTINSFFSAANKTLTTNHYFSLMDNDMESLIYTIPTIGESYEV